MLLSLAGLPLVEVRNPDLAHGQLDIFVSLFEDKLISIEGTVHGEGPFGELDNTLEYDVDKLNIEG